MALREIVASEFAASFADDSETTDELEKTQVDGGLARLSDSVKSLSFWRYHTNVRGFFMLRTLWHHTNLILKCGIIR